MGAGFDSVGLAGLLAYDNPPHFAPKVKRIIYLVLNGCLSQIDSFDPQAHGGQVRRPSHVRCAP